MITEKSEPTEYRILLVEDAFQAEECIRRTLTLASEEFTFEVARRLQDGLQLHRREEFDVVLSDLSLPDSYGIDTVGRLLKDFDGLPIIVLSGLEDEVLAREAVELGAQDFLVKGETTGAELSQCIASAVRRHRLENKSLPT